MAPCARIGLDELFEEYLFRLPSVHHIVALSSTLATCEVEMEIHHIRLQKVFGEQLFYTGPEHFCSPVFLETHGL